MLRRVIRVHWMAGARPGRRVGLVAQRHGRYRLASMIRQRRGMPALGGGHRPISGGLRPVERRSSPARLRQVRHGLPPLAAPDRAVGPDRPAVQAGPTMTFRCRSAGLYAPRWRHHPEMLPAPVNWGRFSRRAFRRGARIGEYEGWFRGLGELVAVAGQNPTRMAATNETVDVARLERAVRRQIGSRGSRVTAAEGLIDNAVREARST